MGEDAKRTLPEDVFRQEYMAEFLEDSAGVLGMWTPAQLAVSSGQFSWQEAGRTGLRTANCSLQTDHWDVLTNEMKRYEYAISPSGGISYNAPAGYHDDCVIALALANHRRWETENVGRMLSVDGGKKRSALQVRRRERRLAG